MPNSKPHELDKGFPAGIDPRTARRNAHYKNLVQQHKSKKLTDNDFWVQCLFHRKLFGRGLPVDNEYSDDETTDDSDDFASVDSQTSESESELDSFDPSDMELSFSDSES